MTNNTLDELMQLHGSDKASVFTRTYAKPKDYCRHYDTLFSPLRDQPIKFLEVGVGGGESIQGWLDYFLSATVYGVDIQHNTNDWDRPGVYQSARYHFCQGDQTSTKFWEEFINDYGSQWNAIIDDGLHSNIAVITTFNALWQHVRPGGFYCVEDLNVGYGGPSFFVKPEWPSQIDFLKGKIDELNQGGEIDSIYFSKELAVIRKSL